MDALTFVLLLDLALLHFGETNLLQHKVGEETTLPCDRAKNCSDVDWSHERNINAVSELVVERGQIKKSPRSHRLGLNSDCSLTIHHITEEDYGGYRCNLDNTNIYRYLRVLTVFPAPSSPFQTGSITLWCTVWRHLQSCKESDVRWLDMNGTVLSGKHVTQNNCVFILTVERQREHDRTFTCLFLEDGKVLLSAELRLKGNSSEKVSGWSWCLILKAVGWGALIGATLVVSIYTKKKEQPKRSSGVFEMVIDPEINRGNMAPPADDEN